MTTDVETAGEGCAHHISLGQIIQEADQERVQAINRQLQKMSVKKLLADLALHNVKIRQAIDLEKKGTRRARHTVWLYHEELTLRGVPPSLRNIVPVCDDDPEHIGDCFAIDLNWLTRRHPVAEKSLRTKKWKDVYKLGTFFRTVEFVAQNYPRYDIWWFVRGLGIPDDIQPELAYITKTAVINRREQLDRIQELARHHLEIKYDLRDDRYKTDNRGDTIDRRLTIWRIAHVTGGSPTRTAELYTAYTGIAMTKQIAANTIEKVKRDLPKDMWLVKKQRTAQRRDDGVASLNEV